MKRISIALLFAFCSLTVPAIFAAQDPAKPAAATEPAKKDEPKAKEPEKPAAKPEEAKPKAEEAPLKPITPAVEARLEAARKAVAELIVEAEDAGLVETTIDQPPILDLLITGRASDLRELKKPVAERIGVSPEVFGAWFTGHGKKANELSGLTVNPQTDVRIIQPVKGLSDWYEKRTNMLNTYVAQARAAKAADAARKADEAKKEEAKPAEPKKEEAKPAEPKKEEAKPAEPKKEEAKPAEPKKEEAKPAEPKKEEAKPAEPKKEEAKPAEPKKDEPKA